MPFEAKRESTVILIYFIESFPPHAVWLTVKLGPKGEVTDTFPQPQILSRSFSHLRDVHKVVDVDHLEAQVVDAALLLAVAAVVPLVHVALEAVDAVRRGHPDALGKVREIHVVLSGLGAGDDGQEAVPPLDLLRDVGGPDLAGGAGGLGRPVQEHHQLEVLLGESVDWELVEGTRHVDHVVEGQRANEEQVVLASVDHEVDVHLVQNDGLSVRRVRGPQQLAVDLAAD